MPSLVSALTPAERQALEEQSASLRSALKTYERAFARDHGGRKPGKDDIRAETAWVEKYRLYARVTDVLSGRIGVAELEERRDLSDYKRRGVQRDHKDEKDSSNSGRRQHVKSTRVRTAETEEEKEERGDGDENANDLPVNATPQHSRFRAIGPTPHRDGKALGLFDLLPNSTPRSVKQATVATIPSSSAKKRRKTEEWAHTPRKRAAMGQNQTPSRSGRQNQSHSHSIACAGGDILDYLDGTKEKTDSLDVGGSVPDLPARYSRTPPSEGKKFLLSQFFATPSADRYTEDPQDRAIHADAGLGTTPVKEVDAVQHETTPAYFKRSLSFKDRLLSASAPAAGVATTPKSVSVLADSSLENDHLFADLSSHARGPPSLRPFRSSRSIMAQRTALEKNRTVPSTFEIKRQISNSTDRAGVESEREQEQEDEDEDEDALDALAELEGRPVRNKPTNSKSKARSEIVVQDSQIPLTSAAHSQSQLGSEFILESRSDFETSTDTNAKMEAEIELDSDAEAALNRDILLYGSRTTAKPYKKKGQKRTTRRSAMRPVAGNVNRRPVFVASDARPDVTVPIARTGCAKDVTLRRHEEDDEARKENEETGCKELYSAGEGDSDSQYTGKQNETSKTKSKAKRKYPTTVEVKDKAKENGREERRINPNALSHTNFRSLKIRNKTSSSGGGRNRGVGRRR